MRRVMTSFSAGALLVLLAIQIAIAREATAQDRAEMAVQVANYIHESGAAAFGGAKAIEIGAAVIEQPGAVADWRAANGNAHGQVAFIYACDHWNVLKVSNGVPLRSDQLVVNEPFPITKTTANRLVAELAALEGSQVTYLKPARPISGC
jgi:hypothetical protein